jgi:enhancer of yellow 2 transcription factor
MVSSSCVQSSLPSTSAQTDSRHHPHYWCFFIEKLSVLKIGDQKILSVDAGRNRPKPAVMSSIKWDNVPDSELRAEVEAVLESQGEGKKIREFLNQHEAIAGWREKVRELCRQLIREQGMDNLTSDILYDNIAAQAHDLIPEEVTEEVKKRLAAFLQTQFEDHV